jgi:hypothetical protein
MSGYVRRSHVVVTVASIAMLALGPISALDEITVPFGVDPFRALVGEFGVQVVSICVVPSIIAVIGTVIRGVVGGSIALALARRSSLL